MDYLKLEAKTFKEFGNSGCIVYFTHTEHYTLIAIPEWNWSFMWDLNLNDEEQIKNCIKALSVPMFESEAEALAARIYNCL